MGLIKDISNPEIYEDDAELDYFLGVVEQFINTLSEKDLTPENNYLTLIASSPCSNIAKAINHFAHDFAEFNTHFRAIFTDISSSEYLGEWLDPDQSPCGKSPADHIRWARSKKLIEAHEQLTLGNIMSWTGESMRREVDTRFGYYIFNENCTESALFAGRSFQALWQVSEKIPQIQLKRSKLDTNQYIAHKSNNQTGLELNTIELLSSTHTLH